MYNPDNEKLKKYMRGEEGAAYLDWHAWLKDLSSSEIEELKNEVLSAESRAELSQYATQYYLHFCIDSNDDKARSIESDFVHAQIDDNPKEEIDLKQKQSFL